MDISKEDVIWSVQPTPTDSYVSCHGYYSNKRYSEVGAIIGESHEGNSALCNKRYGVSEDGDSFLPLSEINKLEDVDYSKVCKKCYHIFKNLRSKYNPLKKGDTVEIIGNIPFQLRNKPRPILATVKELNGNYVIVRPKKQRYNCELYYNELKFIPNAVRN